MKTITGSVISSNPLPLSKAAKIISNFSKIENGSSQAIAAYIRRASVSFNELKQFHREIENPSKSEKKHRNLKSECPETGIADHEKKRKATIEDVEKRKRKSEEIEDEKGSNSSQKHKKKKRG